MPLQLQKPEDREAIGINLLQHGQYATTVDGGDPLSLPAGFEVLRVQNHLVILKSPNGKTFLRLNFFNKLCGIVTRVKLHTPKAQVDEIPMDDLEVGQWAVVTATLNTTKIPEGGLISRVGSDDLHVEGCSLWHDFFDAPRGAEYRCHPLAKDDVLVYTP